MEQDNTPVCPFSDPKFVMDPNEPCPVCGDLGTFSFWDIEDDIPSNCIDIKG